MIGFKYTNIKIQTAYIKFLMYSYLYSLFLLQPAYYYKFILSEFSKDSLSGTNSKQQFDIFIKNNQKLVDNFYSVIESVDEHISLGKYKKNKIKNYIWLTCVLKKDMKTNFSLLTSEEIESIGREEVNNLLFDTFFVVLEEIKDKYNLNLNVIKDEIYKGVNTTKGVALKTDIAKFDTKFDGSIDNLIDSCFFIENVQDIHNFVSNPIFSTYTNEFFFDQDTKENLYKAGLDTKVVNTFEQTLSKHGDFPSKIDELLNQNYKDYPHPYNDYTVVSDAGSDTLLKTDLLKIPEDIGYKGFCGQIFFKIKEQVDVQFRCGSEAAKNPATVSFRSADNKYEKNHDFVYVQKYFDWKNDKTYYDLEQFIFVRQENIKDILKYDQTNKGTIDLKKGFDEKTYTGIKFLEGNDIYTLEEKLINSKLNTGFLALVPIKRQEKTLVDDLISDSKLNLYIGVFSEDQRNLRMSYGDVARLLCKNYKINDKAFDKYDEDKTIIPKTLSNMDMGKRNLELDDLIDCYFSIYLNEFRVDKYSLGPLTAKGSPSKTRYTIDDLLSAGKGTRKFKIENDINKKEGEFILLLEKAVQPQAGNTGYFSFFLNIEKKHVSSIKINTKNKKVFQDFIYGFSVISKEATPQKFQFSKIIDFKDLENSILYATEFGNIGSIKSNSIDNIFLQQIKNNFLEDIKESIKNETTEEEKSILSGIFEGLYDPESNVVNKLISNENLDLLVNNYNDNNFKKTRAYKNVFDFVKYYKNSVESLAKEVQDNV